MHAFDIFSIYIHNNGSFVILLYLKACKEWGIFVV